MAESTVQLHFLAQPQPLYRERYNSELDPKRRRAQRFIRADTNPYNFDYPTIDIQKQWKDQNLYIRVTLVTILTEQTDVRCIHPYPIDTAETNVIKDSERNTLYLPIEEEDFDAGRKSFRIICKKLVQYDLKNYGQLRHLNTDEKDSQLIDNPTDARKMIDFYQLGKSQLVFSLAKLISDHPYPIIYDTTSTYSNIMTAITSTTISLNDDELSIRCVPQKGYWEGGEEILMVVPKIDKRKSCKIIFDHPSMSNLDDIPIEFVDTKTFSFVTPACAVSSTENSPIEIPIVVIQGNEEIARVNFLYQSVDKCQVCNPNLIFDELNTDQQPTASYAYIDESDMFMDDNDQNIKTENNLSGK